MEHNFWHNKWETKEIGFHLAETNPLLLKHFDALQLEKGSRIFLPLCGKTLDIAWLINQGYKIAGAELSEIAVSELFQELGTTPNIKKTGNLKQYSTDNIDIFVGDIFELNAEQLGNIDAIYDRAALVALPETMRDHYTSHLRVITDNATQLLFAFSYDQSLMQGPPFSISNEEVKRHYHKFYQLILLDSQPVEGGLKGVCPAVENIWLLTNKKDS